MKEDHCGIENLTNINKYNGVRTLFRVTALVLRYVTKLKEALDSKNVIKNAGFL